ncbi:hypothetical protein [Empedobacter sp. GD03739]|uniref:hypothetical protein n=1 Tax=Empedobacter sp. GD03739 TaxID=2975376 RepID=UPI0024492A31|nr:hypothetical protein [Empedobacter sp. GD03739]MDH1602373.1 hypothetical protein [Empedobacter sp. GD03739]
MKTGTTNIKLNYKPLNATKSLRVLSGSERQNYNADTMTFEPDRRIDPLVIMVECGVTDPHNLKNGNVNSDLNSVSWKISENGVFKDILESDSDFKIGKNAQKGQLSIYKNISDLEPVTIIFTAKYLEPISKRVVNFQENFDLVTLPIAQTPVTLEATMLVGGTLFVNKNQDGLLTQARLFRGIEQLPAAYYWYKGNTEITDANGYVGSKTERLFIPSSQISKTGDVIRVEVADCSEYVNQLVKQKVDVDPQVVEWRGLYQSEGENLRNNSQTPSFTGYQGSQITTQIVDYNSKKVTHIKSEGGSALIKALTSIDAPKQGEIVSLSVKIKTLTKPVKLNSNIGGTIDIEANKEEYIKWEGVVGNGTGILQIQLRTLTVSESVDLYIWDVKYEIGGVSTNWSPAKQDLNNLVAQKTAQYKSETKLPENYRPATKPAKTYKSDFLLIKKFPEYKEEVLITQGGIDASASSVEAEMIIKTNDGVMQNPEKYFSVGWIKQTNGTFKYKGFKVNISMADIVALNAENKELDYELREDLTLKI